MLKKTITYTDFNDVEQTEDFFFNLTKAELVEWSVSHGGEFKEHLERIVAAEDGEQIIKEMKEVVLGAYGKKSEDGKRFLKSPEIREEFESSEAYSVFFMELLTDAGKAAEFVNAVVPKDLMDQVEQAQTELAKLSPETVGDGSPKKLTEAEVRDMDADELKSGLATGKYIL